MTQQRESEAELQDESPAAPASERCAHRISVIESVDLGIKVRDGHGFDPHRFQEFDFTPEFRDKIMRASLPLLDLRPLLEDQPGHFNWRHASPNDITRVAGNNPPSNDAGLSGQSVALSNSNVAQAPAYKLQASGVDNDVADVSTQSTTRLPSNAMQHMLAGRKLRKGSNRRLDGKPAKKWKLLLFGSSLLMATFLSLAQSQGPALASTTSLGRFALRSHVPQQAEVATAAALPRLQTSLAHLTEQTSKATEQSKVTRTTRAASKPAPKTLWLPAE